MLVEEVGRAYGAAAGVYIERFGTIDAVHADDLDLLGRHLVGLDGPVLDAGCGPGHLTAHLRSLRAEATGLDLTPEFLDHARTSNPGDRFLLGSVRDLPLVDASMAGIVAWYSLIHTPPDELAGVLRELRRVLRPGGVLVVGFFDGEAIEPFDHKVVTAWFWPIDELARRLAAAGFTEVERQQRPGEPYPGPRAHAALGLRAV